MKRSNRIDTICQRIKECNIFADVGCDHGFCSEYVLKNKICKKVYSTDISKNSLSKAEKLLQKYILQGECVPVCCDGLEKLPEKVDSILIAGMGGSEIIKILDHSYLPKNFVFQPMKDSSKLRSYLNEKGALITEDFTFFCEGKYYDLIVGLSSGGTNHYTLEEIQFGKTNLKKRPKDFLVFLSKEIEKKEQYLLSCVSLQGKNELAIQIETMKKILNKE